MRHWRPVSDTLSSVVLWRAIWRLRATRFLQEDKDQDQQLFEWISTGIHKNNMNPSLHFSRCPRVTEVGNNTYSFNDFFFLKHLLNCGLVSEYFRNTQVALVTSCIRFKGHKPKTKYDNNEWKCKHLLKTSINALFLHSIPIKLYHRQLCLQLFVVPESSLHLSVHKHLHECSREVYHETKLMVSKHKISVSVPKKWLSFPG